MAQSGTATLPSGMSTRRGDRSGVRRVLSWTWKFMRKRKLGAIGVILVLLVLSVAILSPFIQRYDDNRIFNIKNPNYDPSVTNVLASLTSGGNQNAGSEYINEAFQSPSGRHWLGTDQFGRDIYARIVVGARLAVLIGVFASLIAVIAGTLIGVVSGYFGGGVDLVVQRFVDGMQAFPALVLLLLIVQVFEQPPLWLTIAALGFLGWATSVRIVRSAVLAIRAQPYVEAARSFGATDQRIMLQHIIPNVLAPVIVVFSISIGAYILAEASLSFLGLGPADKTTWGKMVQAGRNSLDQHPFESLWSGLTITLTVLGFNLAGDAIRDELDPRLRGQ